MLAACIVTDADPVPGRFCRGITLSAPTSTDHPCVLLPPRSPTVITTRRVPREPCVALHLTDVSDSHTVTSQPVCPPPRFIVCDTNPMPAPCTVIDAEPVLAQLTRRITLNAPTSTDHPCVLLPPTSFNVIIILRVPRAPCVTLHLTDVSDTHNVASHPVCPPRARAV